jgi:hypothetical protein
MKELIQKQIDLWIWNCLVELRKSNAAALKNNFLSFEVQYKFYTFIKSILKIEYRNSLKDIC